MNRFNKVCNFSLRSTSVNFGERCWFAHFKVDGDFSQLFPFIQSTANEVIHYEFPEYIQFKMDEVLFSLYPPDIVVSRLFYGREQALEFAQRLIVYLNEVEFHKSQIQPKYKKFHCLHVPDILHFLPMTNCGACGFPTCMAFAGAISRRRARLMMCTHFPEPVDAKIIFNVSTQGSEKVRSIEVDSDLAGFTLSRIKDAEPQAEIKERIIRAEGVTGTREGILFKITGREADVLRLLTQGFTNKEIAQILKVSHNTVKSHVVHIFDKLGVHDRTQAAVWAAQNELL